MKKIIVGLFIILLAGVSSIHYARAITNIYLYDDAAVCDTGDDDASITSEESNSYHAGSTTAAVLNQNSDSKYKQNQNSNNFNAWIDSISFSSNLFFEIFAGSIGLLILIAIIVVIFG